MLALRLSRNVAFQSSRCGVSSCSSVSRGLKSLIIAEHADGVLLPGKWCHMDYLMKGVFQILDTVCHLIEYLLCSSFQSLRIRNKHKYHYSYITFTVIAVTSQSFLLLQVTIITIITTSKNLYYY